MKFKKVDAFFEKEMYNCYCNRLYIMVNMKRQSGLMENCWPAPCRENSSKLFPVGFHHEEATYKAWKMVCRVSILEDSANVRRCADMFEVKGICYAGKCEDVIKVVNARVLTGGMMLIELITGEKRLFDPFTLKDSAFAPLKKKKI